MKWMLVVPRADTPMDTINERLKVGRVHNKRAAAICFLTVPAWAYTRSFWLLVGRATVKIFSSVKTIKLTRLAGYLANSWWARCSRATLFASVSCVARCFLKHRKRKSFFKFRLTVSGEIPVSRAISHCVKCVPGLSSWLMPAAQHVQCYRCVVQTAVDLLFLIVR